jgi:D-glycerate 3-kinase
MPEIQDDKAQHVVPFILNLLSAHQQHHSRKPNPPPFFIGLNGVQGAGKTVLVDILKKTLTSPPYDLSTVVFSLDDLYLTHEDQVNLAKANPENPLLQHRGQPSTHDIPLALSVFESLKESQPTRIPQYNKAAFKGQGDRVLEEEWEEVNADPANSVRVILFEGWCVGFRPLSKEALREKYDAAVEALQSSTSSKPYEGRLAHNTLNSVTTINEALRDYDKITSQFDAFVHIDAQNPLFVYDWRLEQEAGLRAAKGSGMSDEEVRHFVDGYYPSYELYTETLREGVFRDMKADWQARQLRLVVGNNRKVKEVLKI